MLAIKEKLTFLFGVGVVKTLVATGERGFYFRLLQKVRSEIPSNGILWLTFIDSENNISLSKQRYVGLTILFFQDIIVHHCGQFLIRKPIAGIFKRLYFSNFGEIEN